MTDVATDRVAQTDAPLHEVLTHRWSPRAFEPVDVDESLLTNALEAARWSPSANNVQPWRFIVARRGSEQFDAVAKTLAGFNAAWAPNASVLIVAIAELQDAEGNEHPWAIYDLGQAVAHLSIQATADGLHVHQMAGFDGDAVRDAFSIESRFVPFTVVALGTVASPESLSPQLREREVAPRVRKALDEIVVA